MSYKGIDVSKHNSIIDFQKVKAAGYNFVIMRCGIGINTPLDPTFEENYANAKAASLNVGAYWFLRSLTPEAAAKEAEMCLNIIKGKKFEYPIYLDLEDDPKYDYFPFKTGKMNCSAMVKAFLNVLDKAGYFVGLYTSKFALETYMDEEVLTSYSIWVAQWSNQCTYKGSYGVWQYSAKGSVSGIKGDVDLDLSYIDFPATIKVAGKNGYAKQDTTTYKGRVQLDFDTVKEALEFQKFCKQFANAKVVKVKT